jgi:AcrR family transcriptional regulator
MIPRSIHSYVYQLMCYYRAMTRTRLTREESREQTRLHLLEAAQKLIAEKGLAAASVEDITREAGYTRGAFYSNFSSKNQLFLELLQQLHLQEMAVFEPLFEDCGDLQQLRAKAPILFGGINRERSCCICWAEAHLLAARDAAFREQFNILTGNAIEHIARLVAEFHQLAGYVSPIPVKALAFGILSMAEGIQVNQISNPAHGEAWAELILARYLEQEMNLPPTPPPSE